MLQETNHEENNLIQTLIHKSGKANHIHHFYLRNNCKFNLFTKIFVSNKAIFFQRKGYLKYYRFILRPSRPLRPSA